MKIPGALVALLLLGEAVSQSKRNSKAHVKTPAQNRKGPNPSGELEHTAAEEDVFVGVLPPMEDALASQLKSASLTPWHAQKAPEDMKLFFLKNPLVTCNDGTTAGYYLREHKGSKRWIIFLEGGWCCYNKQTCDTRYKNIRRLMSSSEWPQTKKGTGILSSQMEESPHWWNANAVFVPYCSSDIWSGTLPKSLQADYAFMGSLIIQEVIKDLVPKGIKQAKVVLLAGESAGGTGVLLNLERVAALLEELEAEAVQVRGLVDSGWFLDIKHPRQSDCSDAASCAPVGAIKKGLRMWNGILPEKCKQQFKRVNEWQCFLGDRLYSSLKSPVFVVQWLFDEEQLKLENIHLGSQFLTENQWNYLQNLGRELRNSLRVVPAVFAPACLSHTLITKSYWLEFQVKGISLARALQCWEKSLQDCNKAPKIPMRSCPFHLIDNCPLPHFNPTCSVLHDHGTGQEVNFMQTLFRMRLDVHRKAQELKSGPSQLTMLSNGG
ncbi:palmitoleoyl-protein carboxylesterase notum2-like [Terrapene carolina triunguis]|uniref:palmitoleoyl-protein carboxylesterase notum2-like n=1 Tax=Terrapene triunguis TaxID=2587831 RepID=UPI000E77DA99|nr:palmitoleoyl-protein carboxylesterase notum2-like [Terrapene carolina triunguis]